MVIKSLLACLALSFSLLSQDSQPTGKGPELMPGEGLAMTGGDGQVVIYGDASRESPMGSLAKLVWLRMEGAEWIAQGVSYKCTGEQNGARCWLAKGHGKVDLAKATQESCNLAYLTWARASVALCEREMGPGAARSRFEDAFTSFAGRRMPPGDTVPKLDAEWIGDGELLRTSPEKMLAWLMDPAQDELLSRCRRLLLSFFKAEFKKDAWWMKTGTAPVPGDPAATSAWVAGSNGTAIAVLRLPRGRGKAEGLERFKAIFKREKGK